MINTAILTGRLTANPELKTTPSGVYVTTFSIAVNRPKFKDKEQETDFINIVAWRQTAEFISKYFVKGSAIGIEGSIQTRKYTDKNGKNRVAFEVVANQVHFIESKRNGEQENDSTAATTSADTTDYSDFPADDDLPF